MTTFNNIGLREEGWELGGKESVFADDKHSKEHNTEHRKTSYFYNISSTTCS